MHTPQLHDLSSSALTSQKQSSIIVVVLMWDALPFDLLSHIFSFLPPSSLACCTSACRHWRTAALTTAPPSPSRHPPWLLAVPARTQSQSPCFAYDSSLHRWHSLPLSFLPFPTRLIAPIRSLLLCKLAASPALRLLLCNPITRQFKFLPRLAHPRTNPALGTVVDDDGDGFRVFVAGGASGASYEQAVEVYDTRTGEWAAAGTMPLEFAVRLTVWTPNESVYGGDGVMYWATSARAYSAVGFDVRRGEWRELKVPLAERLEWAALVGRGNGRVALVGGGGGEGGCVWELSEAGEWVAVGLVPMKMQGSNIKCVGGGGFVYLFRDLDSKILVGDLRESSGSIEWLWVEGCCYSVPRTPIKAVLLHPSLSPVNSLLRQQ